MAEPVGSAGGNNITIADAIVPAIMVGGFGTRLWPLSRPEKPKQFLVVEGDKSLFQNTVLRVQVDCFTPPWLLANRKTLSLAEAQLSDININPAGLIVEQSQIGTAAAIAALLTVMGPARRGDLVLVLPSDHVLGRSDLFQHNVKSATSLAKQGKIVTFGIVPTAPETGFGYIRPGVAMLHANVVQPGGFVEKPNSVDAKRYVEAGYLWNSGMFLFSVGTMLQEYETHAPDLLVAVSAAVATGSTEAINGIRHHLLGDVASILPAALPIDKVIMEKSHNIVVVPCSKMDWRDVGTLAALQKLKQQINPADAAP